MVKYRNNQRCGCLICVNPLLSEYVNPLLIAAETPVEQIVEDLEQEYGIFLSVADLNKHKEHIVREFDDSEKISERYERIEKMSNLEAINREIARLEVLEAEMREDAKTDSAAYSNIIKSIQKYYEMRIKISGEEKSTVDVNVLPSWISKIKEPKLVEEISPELDVRNAPIIT